MNIVRDWLHRHLSNPQVVLLAVLLLIGAAIVLVLGGLLAPVLAALVIAYLLEGVVGFLQRMRIPRLAAVSCVAAVFIGLLFVVILVLLPFLMSQLQQLVREAPSMIARGQEALMRLPEQYPDLVSTEQIRQLTDMLRAETGRFGQEIVARTIASLRTIFTLVVYLVLLPLLVFFFLKDKHRILYWIGQFLPQDRTLATRVWRDVDQQIGNYIRGKFWEILIVWAATLAAFSLLELEYAMLLSLFVGLSVLVPYLGAIAMTAPVVVIAYFQWGWGSELLWVLVAYIVIQVLDGNLLAPLLLSDATNLHPIAVVVALLVFGGLFGFWGLFFAIPLATLVHAVIKAWPSSRRDPLHDAAELPEP